VCEKEEKERERERALYYSALLYGNEWGFRKFSASARDGDGGISCPIATKTYYTMSIRERRCALISHVDAAKPVQSKH